MNKQHKGFTFVELMVVIAIGALLFSVGTVSFRDITKNSRDARRRSDMEAIRQALELYRSYTGAYPLTAAGIYNSGCSGLCGATCAGICTGTQLYLSNTPVDPKDDSTQYTYTSTGTTYSLQSTQMEKPTTECPVLISGLCKYTVRQP